MFLLDFDGTVSRQDVGFSILNEFSTGSWEDIDREFLEGRIGSPEAYRRIFRIMRLDKDKLREYLQRIDSIDPAFQEFYQLLRGKGWEAAILSDGFGFYIRELLNRKGIKDIPVYSNELCFKEGSIELNTPFSVEWCDECGTCKLEILRRYKKRYDRVIYVGDGYSDRCAIEEADDVFSRRTLWRICASKNIDSWYFHNFQDIAQVLNWKKELIILDLDGTLVDSEAAVKSAYEYVARVFGVEPDRFSDLKKTIGLPLKTVLGEVFPAHLLEQAVKVFRSYYQDIYLELTKPLPEVETSLEWLCKRNYRLCVLTNKHGPYARELIRYFGWDKFIELTMGEGDSPYVKPSGNALLYLLEKVGIAPENALYVGDSLFDVVTAEKAGVEFIGVVTGYTSREEFMGRRVRRLCGNLAGFVRGLMTVHMFQGLT